MKFLWEFKVYYILIRSFGCEIMKTGNLRHYITIEQQTETFNSEGELVTTWSTYKSVWAEILPLVGREFWASKQVNSETTGKLRIRYISGITPKMRIKFGSRILNITGIVNTEEKNKEIVIYYSENTEG
jgi:SPP1 family predicted phage head-tail adaptor